MGPGTKVTWTTKGDPVTLRSGYSVVRAEQRGAPGLVRQIGTLTVSLAAVAVVILASGLPLAAQAPTSDSPDATAFASIAEREVSQLREGVTLAQWMDERGKDERWETSTDEAYFDCRTYVRTETLSSGRQVARMVYFYPPKPPTPAVFPTMGGQELINRGCTLAMIRVQTPAPSQEDGHALEQALRRQFAKKYGDSIGVKETPYPEFADAAHWMPSPLEIISVYDPTHAVDLPDDIGADSVFVFARLPIVHEIAQNSCCAVKAYRYRYIQSTQFRKAIAIAGGNAALAERVLKLYENLSQATASQGLAEPPEFEKSREAVLPVLSDWLGTVRSLPRARRAASLYVADQLLIRASDMGWQELTDKDKTELRTRLEHLGAVFSYDTLGGCYNYSGNWLEEARQLDPVGAVGQMAVLVSLAQGGAPKLGKDEDKGRDIFRTVVTDGEWLLAKNPDPSTAAQVHFIIGDAYSDIVALAGGAEPDYDESFGRDEADSARKKALEHYHAGLAVDGISENAKDAWLQAWHLSAGLLPATRFVYIYD
jgi:hypothetical protein